MLSSPGRLRRRRCWRRTSPRLRECAYSVTDADVEALTAAGLSEDEIFEQTVAAAISQGLRRLDAAEAVIG